MKQVPPTKVWKLMDWPIWSKIDHFMVAQAILSVNTKTTFWKNEAHTRKKKGVELASDEFLAFSSLSP